MNDRAVILIVDDEPLNIDLLSQELEELNYTTISAANGRQALERLHQEHPDLLLLDVMMPEMDGFEVLKYMKADELLREIPVVIISAMADMSSVVMGIELGADDYLPKPFNPAILNARLSAGLARKRARDMEKVYLKSLEREMEIGHQIQAGFLPQSLPDISGWELVAHFQAAREVAGDFYDVFRLPDGRIGLFLGDVTDKGVGAALFMALYRSLLRAFLNAESYISCAGGAADGAAGNLDETPADYLMRALCRTNDYVCRTHPRALFATLFSGVLDPVTGGMVYINAGHNPPISLERGQICCFLPPSGPALGIEEGVDFEVRSLDFAPGESLLVYSDGVVDMEDSRGEFFGEARLRDLVGAPHSSAAGMVESIRASLADFRGERQPYDDVALLAIRRM